MAGTARHTAFDFGLVPAHLTFPVRQNESVLIGFGRQPEGGLAALLPPARSLRKGREEMRHPGSAFWRLWQSAKASGRQKRDQGVPGALETVRFCFAAAVQRQS